MSERVRLHISPLYPELLPTILPPSVLPTASHISYHSLQTFSERQYGYVDLPVMEAQKIKKKLNGSILKGSKISVEEARPEKIGKLSMDNATANEDGAADTKASKASKKRKWEDGVLPGFELPEKRKVKRGWTESSAALVDGKGKKESTREKGDKKAKAKAQPSKFTDQPELLFRTSLPPNATKVSPSTSKAEVKTKKRKKGKSDREVVVHEFSNTTKHASFLRDDQSSSKKKSVLEYVDGKGWVDDGGNVVEPESNSGRKTITKKTSNVTAQEDNNSSHAKSATDSTGQNVSSKSRLAKPNLSDETSSSGTSPSSADEDKASEAPSASPLPSKADAASQESIPIRPPQNTEKPNDDSDRAEPPAPSTSTSSPPSLTHHERPAQKQPTPTSPPTPSNTIHPLEALFKRPPPKPSTSPSRKPTLEVRTSFSFFDTDADAPNGGNNTISTHLPVPQTPFTQRDIQARRLRSAAPTPDTAAPSKRGFGSNLWGESGDASSSAEDDEQDGDEDDDDANANDEDDDDEENEKERDGDTDSTPLARKQPKPNPKTTDDAKGNGKEKEKEKSDSHPESEFAKWFWEHRGETNRAWKRRRREAAKEKRLRENRKRGGG